MSEEAKGTGAGKRPYCKPELRVVDLAADEVLAYGCKNTAYFGSSIGDETCMNFACAGEGT